jgi:hypothetical protein
MDLHKPKPWHGGREFLKEVVTIVIGVLIALGAEAVVEKFHDARLAREARAAVRAEIAQDLANFQRQEQWRPCLDRRLVELSDLLSKAQRGLPFEPAQTIGNPGAYFVQTHRWEAAKAGGRTSLLSLEEQRQFGRLYTDLAAIYQHELAESDAWADLLALQGVARPSPELLGRAQMALAHARVENWRVRAYLREGLEIAASIGVQPTPGWLADKKMLADRQLLCLPISTPHDEAAKLVHDSLAPF